MAKEKKEKKQKKGKEPEVPAEGGEGAVAPAEGDAAAGSGKKDKEKKGKEKKKKRRKRASSPRRLLSPLTPLYRFALGLREFRLATGMEQISWLGCPVISIGNLSTGGTGKTPFTIALARDLARYNLPVDVLSRGYGRQSEEVLRVDPKGEAEQFGDEPLMIAREADVPVYVAAERHEAGMLAEAEGMALLRQAVSHKEKDEKANQEAVLEILRYYRKTLKTLAKPDTPSAEKTAEARLREGITDEEDPGPVCIHLLDDGFQHRQLARTIDILLLNMEDWEDRLLPAGNLREPKEALFRANAIAIPAEEPELETALEKFGWSGPIWKLHRQTEVKKIEGPVLAFCGIARPEQFFEGLEAEGLDLVEQLSFPDHYDYDENILKELIATALQKKAKAVVTTPKDIARLGKLAELFPENLPLEPARLRVVIENRGAVLSWLAERML